SGHCSPRRVTKYAWPPAWRARATVDALPFNLVLAELYLGAHLTSLTPANILRRRVRPVPIGLLTTETLPPGAPAPVGFACVQPMPFDLDALLAHVAAALDRPFTPERERQAAVVRRYFACLEAQDWLGALALCADDVAY